MRRTTWWLGIALFLACSGVASAWQVTIPWSSIVDPNTELEVNGTGHCIDLQGPSPVCSALTLNAGISTITFTFDNGSGTPGSPNENSASVTNVGIIGNYLSSPVSTLSFDFGWPVYHMMIGFALPATTSSQDIGMQLDLSNGDHVDVAAPLGGDGFAVGSVTYTGSSFTQAQLAFPLDAQQFVVTDLSFDFAPEPGTFALFGAGLLGLGIARFRKRA